MLLDIYAFFTQALFVQGSYSEFSACECSLAIKAAEKAWRNNTSSLKFHQKNLGSNQISDFSEISTLYTRNHKKMTATRNNAILPTIMGEMLCAFLLCFLCCTASPLPSNRSYHYGYDNGQRTPLMQLHDGLYLQSIIMQNVISDEVRKR